jgi:hypothetical protein
MTRKNVYLGKTVPDIGKPGLDKLAEVKGIALRVLDDYRAGDVTYRTAMSRLNLLTLIVTKDSDFDDPEKEQRPRNSLSM